MIICIEQWVKYTRRNGKGKDGRPQLVDYSSEINMLENSIHNSLVLHYTTLLNNFHFQTQGDSEASRSTVNLALRRILPKTTKCLRYGKEEIIRVSGKRQGIDK